MFPRPPSTRNSARWIKYFYSIYPDASLRSVVFPIVVRFSPARFVTVALFPSEHASCGCLRVKRLYLPPISVSTVIGRFELGRLLGYTFCCYYAVQPASGLSLIAFIKRLRSYDFRFFFFFAGSIVDFFQL